MQIARKPGQVMRRRLCILASLIVTLLFAVPVPSHANLVRAEPAIILGLFAWTPAIAAEASRTPSQRAVAESVNRRLAILVTCGLIVLGGATALVALAQTARATGRSLAETLNARLLCDYLVGTHT